MEHSQFLCLLFKTGPHFAIGFNAFTHFFNNAIVNLSLCLNETFKEDTDIFTYVRKL